MNAFRSSLVTKCDTARIISEATRRADAIRPTPKRGLRKHADLIVVGIAAVVAGTSLQRKRQYDETRSMLEAEVDSLKKAQSSHQHARQLMEKDAVNGVKNILTSNSKNVDEQAASLREWINKCYDQANDESGRSDSMKEKISPGLI